jgi:serine protease Do
MSLLQRAYLMKVIRGGMTALAVAALLTGGLERTFATDATAPHLTQHGPQSVADLAEGLVDAVVNIAITQNDDNANADDGFPSPNLPKEAPFHDLFDDYFKDKNKDSAQKAHKVTSLGSGFVIDPSGYIVTNNHVIENADDIEVNFADGSKLKARLIGTDTKTDLALLKVDSKKPLKFVSFGDSRKMRIGDWVMAIGNPFGLGGSVSIGIVSARNRNINAGPYDNFIQTDAAINRGNSGGPLFNMFGEVIGINTAIISPSGGSIGIGFAIPTEIASQVIEQLKDFGEIRRGWLGVRIQPVTDDMVAGLNLDAPKGALVSGIIKGGPVDNGSLLAGDVILKFNGEDISEMRDLPRVVAESPVGKPIDVLIVRAGKQTNIKVTLSRQKNDAKAADKSDPLSMIPDDNQQDPNAAEPPAQPATPADTLGLTLSELTSANRKQFGIPDSVEGVLITDVPTDSQAYGKGLRKGDVIVEVAQDFVETPDDVANKISDLKANDRRNAYLMLADSKGNLRMVAVPIE